MRSCKAAVALVRASREGFTLTEILLVIGIVAVLGSLIFTGGVMVRRRVDLFHCQANLHQLGLAVQMYVADCGTLPLVYYEDATNCPPRPPCPPPDHDLAMVLADYVSDRNAFECPVTHRYRPGWGYHFNSSGAGLRLSQLKTPKHRAMIICDRFESDQRTRQGQGGRENALFLDGHVKAYPSVGEFPLWGPNEDGSPYFPHD